MSDSIQEWDTQYLGEIVEIMIGGTPSRANPRYWDSKKETKNIWVSIRDLNRSWITESTEYLSDEGVQNSNVKLVPKGTVLMSFKLTVGRVARAGRDLYTNEAIAAFELKKNLSVVPEFLYYGLQEWDLLAEVDQAIKGATLNKEKLGRIACELPPLAEQKKIAEILSSVDEVIENTESEINKLEDLKKATLNELLTKGIGHTEFKDSEIGRIPKSWQIVSLSEIGAFHRGRGISKSETQADGFSCLRYAEIYTSYDILVKAFQSKISADSAEDAFLLRPNDICFAGSGETIEEIGKSVTYIHQEEVYAGGDIVVLRPKKEVDSVFICCQLNGDIGRKQLRRYGQGSSVMHIYSAELAQVKIALPDIREQEIVGKLYSCISQAQQRAQFTMQKYLAIRRGIQNDLLTGKVRVKVN